MSSASCARCTRASEVACWFLYQKHTLMSLLRRVAFVAVAIGAIAACEAQRDAAPASADQLPPQTLHRGNGGDPGSLDPALAEDIHAFNVLADIYEGLVTTDARGQITAGVAARWDVSDDGLSYRFDLRDDARWSNGEPVVADDFVRAFTQFANKDSMSPYGFLLEPIRNFDRVQSGELPADQLGVVAENNRQLTIHLHRPTSYFLSILSMPLASPRHATNDLLDDRGNAEALISNGAYVLTSRQPGGIIQLKRNEHYWDKDNVTIADVTYHSVVDENTEFNRYLAGELHITQSVPGPQIAAIRESRADEIRISPMLALYYLAFDLTEEPFDRPIIREALSLAIDREQLVAVLGRGEQPAYSVVPSGVAGYMGPEYEWQSWPMSERERRARVLLEESGYDETNPLALTYLYDAGGVHENIALAIGAMWEETLSVDVSFEKREWKHFLEARDQREAWEVMRFSWFGDYNDPETFLRIFTSDSPQNLARFSNAAFDRLLTDANSLLIPAERFAGLLRAERILLDEFPVIPLYFYVSKHMVSPDIRGFEDNVLDRHPSRYMSFDVE